MHPRNPGYQPGNYWMVCDRCGFDYRRSEMKKEWTGLWVCKADWDPRHPLDFVKGIKEDQSVPVARPEKEIVTISIGSVTADDL